MQHTSTAAAYYARILKLRLPEQDSLKNAAERCSADPVSLTNIGRAVGQKFESSAGTILVSLLFIRSISRIQTIPAGPISFAQA